jgi:predicted transposase YbfD/YdcC
LIDIVILSVLAVLSGTESWNAIELYGKENIVFLRKRNRRAAENFAVVRKIALNLLKKDTSTKISLVSKHLKVS